MHFHDVPSAISQAGAGVCPLVLRDGARRALAYRTSSRDDCECGGQTLRVWDGLPTRHLRADVDNLTPGPTIICIASAVAKAFAEDDGPFGAMRGADLGFHCVGERLGAGNVHLEHLNGKEPPADVPTKL